jgi:hypothetical protein
VIVTHSVGDEIFAAKTRRDEEVHEFRESLGSVAPLFGADSRKSFCAFAVFLFC